jgi:hypothetical protein
LDISGFLWAGVIERASRSVAPMTQPPAGIDSSRQDFFGEF